MRPRAASLVLATLFSSLSLGGCAAGLGVGYAKPIVTLVRAEPGAIDFRGATTNLVVRVENTNPMDVDLVSLGYRVLLDGHARSEGSIEQQLHVENHAGGELTVPIHIAWRAFASTLDALGSRSRAAYAIELVLGFQSPSGVVPISVVAQGVLPVPRAPEVTLVSAAVAELGVGKGTLELELRLKNPNAFTLAIGKLDGKLALDGAPLHELTLAPAELAPLATQVAHVQLALDLLALPASAVAALSSRTGAVTLECALALGGYVLPLQLTQPLR